MVKCKVRLINALFPENLEETPKMCLRDFCLHVKLPGRVHLSTKIQDSESKTRLQNPNPKRESKIKLPKLSKVVLLSATLLPQKRRYSQRLSSASFAPKTSVALHLNFQNPKPQSPSKSMQSSAHMQKFGGNSKKALKKKRKSFVYFTRDFELQ